MVDKIRPAVSKGEEISIAKKLGASDKQAKEIAAKRMADPKAVPGANSEEDKKIKEWWKTAKPGDYYTSGKGPGNVQEDIKNLKGTQKDHAVTDNSNHTQTIGGMIIKTPVATKTDSTTKTPVKPNISLTSKTPVATKTDTKTKTPVNQQGKTINP